jgi:beta-lactamase regulating signal transducer with metallopeptidase domain
MTAAWVVYVLGVGTLLTMGAVVLGDALRQLGRSTRFVFAAAVAGILVLAVVAPRPSAVTLPLPVSVGSRSAPVSSEAHGLTLNDRIRTAREAIGNAAITVSVELQQRVSPALARVVVAGWIGTSVALLLLFVFVNLRLHRARREWPVRVLHGTKVRVTSEVGPAVLGYLPAQIAVPHWLLERPPEEQRLILAHECEHLSAHDHLLLGGTWLAVIALPWHPALWYLANRIRLAIELDCDARVLREGVSARSYGALLIDMAARRSAVRIGALAMVDAPSHLERRIRAMQWKCGLHAVARGIALVATAALLVLAACEAKVPTAAEVSAMDVNAVEKRAAQLDLGDAKIAKADYFVNGVPVSGDSARAIVAEKIGSVEVVKSRFEGGRDTILVTTADRMSGLRTREDDDLVPFPAMARAMSGGAVLVIDGVVQQPGIKSRLDPKEVTSVSVMKPGHDAKYPNGLIAIETKRPRNRTSAERRPERVMMRTDTIMVRTPSGLVAATRPLSAELRRSADRTVLLPGGDSAAPYRFGVGDVERTQLANSKDSSGAPVLVATFDSRKPFAITIDGVRATMSQLEALKLSDLKSQTMYPRDARAMSSDPAAANGLLQVITKRGAKP